MKLKTILAFLCAFVISSTAMAARDYVFIVGSSTVYPFTTVAAENFSRVSAFKAPKVESTGTGGGFKLFCAGIGVQHPDMTNASRAVKQSEIELCKTGGVTDIGEIKVGYDGIVVANSKKGPLLNLTPRDLWRALAEKIVDDHGHYVKNYLVTWKDVRSDLPNLKIEVLGPPPTSGTRDAFVELAMEAGCNTYPQIKALKGTDKVTYKQYCHNIREDGGYVEAGENDNLIVQKLLKNENAFGIFGFSFLDANTDTIQGALINGIPPEFDTIAEGDYPISRPLFIYLKKQHLAFIPGLREFVVEYTSVKAMGEEGYLSEKGLIPLPEDERLEMVKGLDL